MNKIEGREVADRGSGDLDEASAADARMVTTRRGRSLAVLVSVDELAALEDDLELDTGSRLVA
ncbi:hypothetical protein [Actinoalloteichus hymeniacidonis]|uniref:hypothetical protein n=1 Tax=Actinoalloteichus hymeniacidonis TaxID=340345 RepID=UPI000852CC4A|nr:hypothetical protein [Actinoalloteichus hymeniacidonis]MBB5910712.1 PHD/YefM family antitoxin component YafN of YafNO toxin-antitoxin module [Actinoalloteichus hymeniacidonis]